MRPALMLIAPLAACASTGDYPGARPAPVASAAPLAWPTDPFVVTAPGPAGAQTPYNVLPTPSVLTPLRSYNTDGTYYNLPRTAQPGVLPPLRRYNTNGSYAPEPMPLSTWTSAPVAARRPTRGGRKSRRCWVKQVPQVADTIPSHAT